MTNTKRVLQEKIIVDSKLIDYMIYNYETKLLEVKYKHGKNKGKVKQYPDFDSSALDQIVQSSSPGKALKGVLSHMKKEQQSKSFLSRLFSFFSF